MIPKEARTRASIIAFELHLDPERPMENVCSSCLYACNADVVESFSISPRIALLFHDELSLLDLDVACFKFGVQTDIVIVRLLPEVVKHPVFSEMFCLGISKEVGDVWVLGEILDQPVGVNFSRVLDCIATGTVINGCDNGKAAEDD